MLEISSFGFIALKYFFSEVSESSLFKPLMLLWDLFVYFLKFQDGMHVATYFSLQHNSMRFSERE